VGAFPGAHVGGRKTAPRSPHEMGHTAPSGHCRRTILLRVNPFRHRRHFFHFALGHGRPHVAVRMQRAPELLAHERRAFLIRNMGRVENDPPCCRRRRTRTSRFEGLLPARCTRRIRGLCYSTLCKCKCRFSLRGLKLRTILSSQSLNQAPCEKQGSSKYR
jgi:hypothetical protein